MIEILDILHLWLGSDVLGWHSISVILCSYWLMREAVSLSAPSKGRPHSAYFHGSCQNSVPEIRTYGVLLSDHFL
jgi:hypothetical protein